MFPAAQLLLSSAPKGSPTSASLPPIWPPMSKQTLVIKLDKTPPSITGARTPLANANGWSNMDVTVSFACSDVLSGLAPGSPPGTALVSSEGVNQQVPGVCLDLAGNTASAIVSRINIDKTPPTI